MGYPNDKHIKHFVRYKAIKSIRQSDKDGCVWIKLRNGEALRLYPHINSNTGLIEMIATPFKANGEVKQSTEIV